MTAQTPQKLSISLPPKHAHDFFEATLYQTYTAVDCLNAARQKASEKGLSKEETDEKLYPYLIHTAVLFAMARNQLSFQTLFSHPDYKNSGLQEKIKTVPTYAQQYALVNSLKDDMSDLSACLKAFSDDALGLQRINPFYANFQRLGVGHPEGSKAESISHEPLDISFQPVPVDVQNIVDDLISAWDALVGAFNRNLNS